MCFQCSANITPCAIEQNNDKGKQREELPVGTDTPPPDDTFSLVALDSDDNRKLWKSLMGAQGKGTASGKKSSANMTCNPSPEVVEVYAVRGFQVSFSFISFRLSFLLVTETTEVGLHTET